MYKLGPWAYGLPKILLGYYQIYRLQYCFSEKQVHSKYGYPTLLFITLYIIGCINNLHSLIFPFFVLKPFELPNNLGCENDVDGNEIYSLNSFIATTLYSIWDLFTLFLYIYKIHQATKTIQLHQKGQEVQDQILTRIKKIMAKIVFLTVIYEMVTTVMVNLFLWGFSSSPIVAVGWAIDFLTTQYIMYLMLDHNSNSYLTLLKLMHVTGILRFCCCCFRNLLMDSTQEALAELVTNKRRDTDDANQDENVDENIYMDRRQTMRTQQTPGTINTETLGVPSAKDLYEERSVNHSVATEMEIVCDNTCTDY